jgi:purine-binding chemotaxis protein CheW
MKKQYLIFVLDNTLYGIDVCHVREVLVYIPPLKIPCSLPCIEGLINSRDHGIIVVNLRKKFLLPETKPTKKTRIIVMEIRAPVSDGTDSTSIFGAVADEVREVIEIDDDTMESVPKFGNTIPSEYVSGLGRIDSGFIVLLDIDKVFENCDAGTQPALQAI